MMLRIPLNALQAALYAALTTYQGTPVYDGVPEEAALPYITLGAFTCKPNGAKLTDIADLSLQVHVWSEYRGKREVNEIANGVVAVLASVPLDLSADNFAVLAQDVDFFEAFDEDNGGYHGVVTLVARVQNIGGIN